MKFRIDYEPKLTKLGRELKREVTESSVSMTSTACPTLLPLRRFVTFSMIAPLVFLPSGHVGNVENPSTNDRDHPRFLGR